MAPNDTSYQQTATNAVGPIVPDWISEDYFVDVLEENVNGFKKIVNFDVTLTAGDGENYASVMLRIKIILELQGGSTGNVCYMVKTLPQSEQTKTMISAMGFFPKERTMYYKYLPEFEQMYMDIGKNVTFGPKSYRFKKDPGVEYVLLEDISPKGFKNANRLEGLDIGHTESVLRLISAYHAASAVRREIKGDYDITFLSGPFGEEPSDLLETMRKGMKEIFIECLQSYEIGIKYIPKIGKMHEIMADQYIKLGKPNPDDFNVMLHGDLWVNNIMFQYNDEGKLEDTVFVDFQMSRYGNPVVDLYYFLLSSTKYDFKTSQFDYFVKYYYDHLVENLILLNYPKKIPTLRQLRIDFLRYGFWAIATICGIMGVVLLDPTKDANIDNFMQEGIDGRDFKMKVYKNPRYIKHMELVLPWLDTMGLLDLE